MRFEQIHRTKRVARAHDRNPRDDLEEYEFRDMEGKEYESANVKNGPEPRHRTEALRANAVEKIVSQDYEDRDCAEPAHGFAHRRGHDDHRRAERPDHAEEAEGKLKCPGSAYDREFEHDEPEAARPEKAAEFGGSPSQAVEKCAGAR